MWFRPSRVIHFDQISNFIQNIPKLWILFVISLKNAKFATSFVYPERICCVLSDVVFVKLVNTSAYVHVVLPCSVERQEADIARMNLTRLYDHLVPHLLHLLVSGPFWLDDMRRQTSSDWSQYRYFMPWWKMFCSFVWFTSTAWCASSSSWIIILCTLF